MDAIERFERRRQRTFGAATLFAAAICGGLWYGYSSLQQRADKTDLLLEEALVLLRKKLPVAPPPASGATYSWTASRAFKQGSHEACEGAGSDFASEFDPCDWKWQSSAGTVDHPIAVIRRAHQAARPVVVIVSAGHDDVLLNRDTEQRLGTNFNLAYQRSVQLANRLVMMATGTASCDLKPPPTVHCVPVARGAPGSELSKEEQDLARTPRLTVITGA